MTTGVEVSALRLGSAVVTKLATTWLKDSKAKRRRGASLVELISFQFGALRERDRRGLRRKLDEIGDLVGERLRELVDQEFRGLEDNERVAALEAAIEALQDADLSDSAFLRNDIDPIKLANEVRRGIPSFNRRVGLNEAGCALFDMVLDHACVQLVYLVRELPELEGRLAEESLRRATDVLGGVDQLLERLPTTSLDALNGTNHDEQFRRRYLDLIAKHYDDLELIGVSVRNFRPRTTLSIAYLSLTVNQTVGGRQADHVADGYRFGESYEESSTLRVETALSTSDRMLIRGEAGSGKSTLLRWLAITAARREFSYDLAAWNDCIPILIKLRSYADQQLPRPEQFLEEATGPIFGPVPDGWTHRQLEEKRALLLVDGVDELSSSQRPKVRRWLRTLLTRYPGTRVVVTSRPAAAGTRWLTSESFASVDLENMTPNDAREFLERWHKALLTAASGDDALPFSWTEVEAHRRSLLSQLDARAHLRNLARSPLMCAMLCALHLDRGGDLPRDRKSLYEAALEMLLDRREIAREIPSGQEIALSYRTKLTLLQDIAFWLNLNGRSEIQKGIALARIKKKLETIPGVALEAESCLNYLLERSGVIRSPVEGRVDFVHRTFQEFLAAREAADEGHTGLLIEKAHSDQWHETTIMAAGLLNRPSRAELINGILDRIDRSASRSRRRLRLLAATCRESVHELPIDVLNRLDKNIQALVPPRNLEESRSLATVGEPILDELPQDLSHLSNAQAAACALTAALVNGPRAMEILRSYACDKRTVVQDELIDAWPLYEPYEYARHVLAEAPLHNGAVIVEDTSLVPHLRELTHLRRSHLDIVDSRQRDLVFTNDARGVHSLRLVTDHDVSIDSISNHRNLRKLTLVANGSIEGLHHLRSLPNLSDLFINQIRGLTEIDFLDGIFWLTSLRLGNLRNFTDFQPLANLTKLTELTLDGGNYEAALAALQAPQSLKSLSLMKGVGVSLQFVAETFPNLRYLALHDPPLISGCEVDKLSRLKVLCVPYEDTSMLQRIADIPWITNLYLWKSDVVDVSPLLGTGITVQVNPETQVLGIDHDSPDVRIIRTPWRASRARKRRIQRRDFYDRKYP